MSKKKRSRETEKKKLPVFPIVVAVLIVAGLFVVIANPFDKQSGPVYRYDKRSLCRGQSGPRGT
jgi:hypothetical protein